MRETENDREGGTKRRDWERSIDLCGSVAVMRTLAPMAGLQNTRPSNLVREGDEA